MNFNKKIKIVALIAFIVACTSLGIGYSTLNSTLNINATANVVKNKWDVSIANIHDINATKDTAILSRQPIITDNSTVNLAADFKQPSSKITFLIDIANKGNIDGKISKITLNGLEQYNSYLTYKIEGIKENDKIAKNKTLKNIKVTIEYTNPLINQDSTINEINIDNLNLMIEFKQL